MSGFDIRTDNGGVVISVFDDDNNKREIRLRADDEGNIEIEGRGPSGNKVGKMDPSGDGNNPLGK